MAWDDDPYDTSYPSQQRRESTPLEDIFASLFAGMPTNPAAYVAEQKRLDQQRREERNTGRDALDPYIGASDPRTMGRVRGSPAGGLPVQADEASPFALTRERIKDELDNNAGLRRAFDASTTAEVGTDPAKRRWYQALTIDRAVQTGKPLLEVVNNPDYYPSSTTNKSATTGMGTDPSLWEGANPANFATGNASRDPRTGRDVGFAGGPQTSSFGAERGGIEGQGGLPYARAMGYTGPSTSAIGFGPNAPQGNDLAGLTPGTSPENYGSVASLNGRRRMDDTQPPGLLSMFGGGRQQNLDGRPQGLLGALDPEMMGYLAMMVKGASPGSSLDPEGLLKLAQARRSSEQDQLLRQQQLGISQGHLNVSRSAEQRQQSEIDRKIAEADAARRAYQDISSGGGSIGATPPAGPPADGDTPAPTAAPTAAPDAATRIQQIDKYLSAYPDSKFSAMLEREKEKLSEQLERRGRTARETEERRQLGQQQGLQGKALDEFVLTGKISNRPELTATDRKAIYSAEDQLPAIQGTKEALTRALELNPNVLTGWGAGLAGSIQSKMALEPKNRKQGEDTVEWNRIMSREAISQMSQALKGATTDFELKKFEDILGDPSTPVEVRKRTIERMLKLAERQEEIARDRINQLRSNDYFKPGGGASKTQGGSGQQAPDPLGIR